MLFTRWKMGKLCKAISVVILSVSVLVGITGCGSIMPKEEQTLAPPLVKPPKVTYTYAKVTRGSIVRQVTGTGTFISRREVSLSFKDMEGRLKDVYVKIGDKVKKGQLLAEIETGDLPYRLQVQGYELQKAKIRLDQAINNKADKYTIELLKLDLKEAQLQYDILNEQLQKSKMLSPMDGVVTFVDENVKQGTNIAKYQTFIKVADPSNVQLYYQALDMSNYKYVKIGMKADVVIDGKHYTGTVTISPSDTAMATDDNMKNAMLIKVDNLPPDIKMGHIADFTIVLQKKDNVLLLPIGAIRSYMGRTYVQVMEGDKKREIDVETGIQTATQVEIVSGLKEGQQVILR
ncbi:RND family efflux transporter, MFP subunit [Caldanaerobius fijiensis DSM 17918]|uniref:RND family efflux transporter, MFP subunit n=1 Tax=Caldanaerobius fijiensis DSM 17918 TaxID=1121256 RepID=A0A1M5C1Q6_9THEO|nr:efflux RND transporter periplasmic adaptor subunit [Caldanaerobius fijiensis]SHF48679.1 RND family efflux transporter, MFP subunit [Caldanaerobius fijiensis DSM 17918]